MDMLKHLPEKAMLAPLFGATIVLMLLFAALPDRYANRAPRLWSSVSTFLFGLSLLAVVAAAAQVATAGPIDVTFARWNTPWPICLGVRIDALALVMAGLISFLGLIISRYSRTYLLGDHRQGTFIRWLSFTLGATLAIVLSCNLVLLTAAWMLTSFGLHQLLTYYSERSWAVWTARKKFLISRLGDAMLIGAVLLAYRSFGTTEYTEMFTALEQMRSPATLTSATSLIGVLVALGAMTKSAQFPFHTWLPDTMETPTPVSALMHAGVINAGGFLVVRLSPLVALSPVAMNLLVVVGAITALLGSAVMLTQTSIKRSLAYSTIGQMGFMMLQCGLGAFPAALLHIVAHSTYKAHAFLSCGSVLEGAARAPLVPIPAATMPGRIRELFAAVLVAAGIVLGTFRVLGIDLVAKAGGALLGCILIIALTQLLWTSFSSRTTGLTARAIGRALLISIAYSAGYLVMERLLRNAVPLRDSAPSSIDLLTLIVIVSGFLAVFALQALSGALARTRWGRALYVHLVNGFYLDIPARKITARIYGQAAPVQ